jgi:uncharacterized membrane protein YkvA (DUF1232 family)
MGSMRQMGISDWKARAGELKREAYALYLCSRHPKTPLRAKVFALFIVGYAMSPIDLIPDLIPVIGYVDDLVLIPLGIALLVKMMPKDVLEECRLKAQSLQAGKPMGWVGAVLIICIWTAAIYMTYRLVVRML